MLVVFLHPSAGPLGPRYPRQCVFQLRLHAASSSPLASARQAAAGWHYSGLAPGSGPSGIGFSLVVKSWEEALNRSCFLAAAWGRCGGGTLIFELRVQRRKVDRLHFLSHANFLSRGWDELGRIPSRLEAGEGAVGGPDRAARVCLHIPPWSPASQFLSGVKDDKVMERAGQACRHSSGHLKGAKWD